MKDALCEGQVQLEWKQQLVWKRKVVTKLKEVANGFGLDSFTEVANGFGGCHKGVVSGLGLLGGG